ncbi:LTA synthase family protein [Camelliibacillus cellulosilyticus]
MTWHTLWSWTRSKYGYLTLAMALFWMKSYIAFKTEFHLDIENHIQGFILFISPISSILFFFGFSLLFRDRLHRVAIILIDGCLTIILYANVLYYRFFDDFITLPDVMQFKNFGQLGGSTMVLIAPHDAIYWIDLLLLITLAVVLRKWTVPLPKKWTTVSLLGFSILIFLFNLSLAESQRSQLLTRMFDRAKVVKLLGLYNYHIYDVILNIRSSSQKALADSSDAVKVETYIKTRGLPPNSRYFGAAKRKNVILVSLESTQSFLNNYKIDGQEVTPFLNSLTKDVFYFDRFYHNTGQGKTSDAEFLIDNSLYPLPRGAVFTTHAHNRYFALPAILHNYGYTSVVFHGNQKSFWNRDIMYKTLSYDRFFAEDVFRVDETNTINYGLKDKSFFEQAVPMLQQIQQPFYAKFILLTNHFPFILGPGDETIAPAKTKDRIVNRYFQTARYEDEALQQFFEQLKAAGLYENSVIILYGDHYGISENHDEAMAEILGVKKLTPFMHYQLQKVPLFIHIPGYDGKASQVMHTIGGEIDLKPTILHLLGIPTDNDIAFGSDLFLNGRNDFTIERDGSFISDQYLFAKPEQICYKQPDGRIVDRRLCMPGEERAAKDLKLSDKVIYGDLLRFINNKKK